MTPVTYGDLIARAARAVHDGAAQVQHRPFDTTTEALSAMADFHGVLDAVEGHTWAIINPARAAGITSSHWPEPAEIAALGMAAQIRRVTGTLRPHPSLLRPAVGPWGEAARCLRAASDLLAVHRNLDGTPRSPDAGAIEDRAGRAGALARVGDLADAVVAMEDFLALRDDAQTLRGWYRNRVCRVVLVFMLTNLGSMFGVWISGAQIMRKLLG
jgi:hypothetical protein